MSAPVAPPAGLTRARLAQRCRAVLSRGGARNADVLLVESGGDHVVVKDFAPRGAFVRGRLGPWLLRREVRVYRSPRRHGGGSALPRMARSDGDRARISTRGAALPAARGSHSAGFVDELAATIDEMHRRGVVHLDLRHRSNLLAGVDGHPIVIDFASALVFDVSTRFGRRAVEKLAAFDRRALEKWRVRSDLRRAQATDSGSSAGSRAARRPM